MSENNIFVSFWSSFNWLQSQKAKKNINILQAVIIWQFLSNFLAKTRKKYPYKDT